MTLNRRNLIVLAALGSAGLLLAAFGFQHLGDLPPCKMCIWQRWPHGAALGIGLIGALFPHRSALAFLIDGKEPEHG